MASLDGDGTRRYGRPGNVGIGGRLSGYPAAGPVRSGPVRELIVVKRTRTETYRLDDSVAMAAGLRERLSERGRIPG
jgi:hypothetical protein